MRHSWSLPHASDVVGGFAGGPLRVGPSLAMRAVVGFPSPLARDDLNDVLEGMTRINARWFRNHPEVGHPYTWGGVWVMEPESFELFDPAPLVLARGCGDCDDWGPILAAWLRVYENDPGARADCYVSHVAATGRRTWHCITVRGDGRIIDPSAALGMPTHAGHARDGEQWADVYAKHRHLEQDDPRRPRPRPIPQTPPSTMETRTMSDAQMGLVRWDVRRTPDGNGWMGEISFPCDAAPAAAAMHAASGNVLGAELLGGPVRIHITHGSNEHPHASREEATRAVFTHAEPIVHGLAVCGLGIGDIIPGLLSTASDVVRTFTGSPQSAPPQYQAIRQAAGPAPMPYGMPPMPYGFPMPMPYGPPPMPYGPPAYGPPAGYK